MISNDNFCPVTVFNGAQICLLKNDPTFFRKIFRKFFFNFFMVLNQSECHCNHIDTYFGDHRATYSYTYDHSKWCFLFSSNMTNFAVIH